jgi:hypothetical protein
MTISYARHQYPPPVIQHAVWLYLCFTVSFRDVEDLLAERGLERPQREVCRSCQAITTTDMVGDGCRLSHCDLPGALWPMRPKKARLER